MPSQTWICLDAAERGRYWWRTGFVTLIFIGMAVAAWLTTSAVERWWWIGGVAVFYLVNLVAMVNQGTGVTLLTSEGMEFRTLLRRRSVPWSEVAGIVKRYRTRRSGTLSEVCVVRVQGGALTVPGAFTLRMYDRKFDAKLAAIRECWTHAADA
ncbi:PH domain-containing protein [Streptomyces sp. NPDC102405]|uniref:PH domain-containing protein n=1 Tax=Streptomyces sp. NPDC102405 TaxID=3366170 RepID=UPI00380C92E0